MKETDERVNKKARVELAEGFKKEETYDNIPVIILEP